MMKLTDISNLLFKVKALKICPLSKIQGTFTQWLADNVDHNVATLSGEGTFHGMGIIAILTPKDKMHLVKTSHSISRQQRLKVSEFLNDKGVLITQYVNPPEKGLASMIYKPILQLQTPHTLPLELCSDLETVYGHNAVNPYDNWKNCFLELCMDIS